jgi:hypothetical protein
MSIVILLSGILPKVIMQSFILLSVIFLRVFLFRVILPIVIPLSGILPKSHSTQHRSVKSHSTLRIFQSVFLLNVILNHRTFTTFYQFLSFFTDIYRFICNFIVSCLKIYQTFTAMNCKNLLSITNLPTSSINFIKFIAIKLIKYVAQSFVCHFSSCLSAECHRTESRGSLQKEKKTFFSEFSILPSVFSSKPFNESHRAHFLQNSF